MTMLALPLGAGLSPGSSRPASASSARLAGGAKVLVAYYTRTGNTRVIAAQISRALGADIFEIATVDPYPEDYKQQVAVAEQQREPVSNRRWPPRCLISEPTRRCSSDFRSGA
ncbi:hypothetical protein [Mesorhizobium sp. M7A.F.Ce.TU.012.03.2.1]|uniref:hypothetical protein n=1 Tax=Mesorhizobium sp. M7A.F.Ce.TU.012.03.2.1 TaxID=2493681 RepID=UPI001FDEEEEE|nr:hypothetical protein [Mesorhizobium sp. M7A.F.Ce.TU.012.03.2.1]